MDITLEYENALYARGYAAVGGVDEAGRGPLAGPVAACALVMPRGLVIPGVDDSKRLPPQRRAELAILIEQNALACAVGWADAATVDDINILQATYLAMRRAVAALGLKPDALLVDGRPGLPVDGIHCEFIVGGDARSHSIAAASIVAKEARDAFMRQMGEIYPAYGFAKHKGYGTRFHYAALAEHGLCPLHRRSFVVERP
jgi:ribonuclease HII